MKNEELRASLKIDLLDNEENLFDLGLYVGLGGTVLSLILLLVLDVKQDILLVPTLPLCLVYYLWLL